MRHDDLRNELERVGRLPVPEPRTEFVDALAQRLHLVDLTPAPLPQVPERRQALARYRMVAGGAIAAVALSAVGASYVAGSRNQDTGVNIAAATAVGFIQGEDGTIRNLESTEKVREGDQIFCEQSGEVSFGDVTHKCGEDQPLTVTREGERYLLVPVEEAAQQPPDSIMQPDGSDLAAPVTETTLEDTAAGPALADEPVPADTTVAKADEVNPDTVVPDTAEAPAPVDTTEPTTTLAPTTTVTTTSTTVTTSTQAVETTQSTPTSTTSTTEAPTTTTTTVRTTTTTTEAPTTTTTTTEAPKPVVVSMPKPTVVIEGTIATLSWEKYVGSNFGRYVVFQTGSNTEEFPDTATYPPSSGTDKIYDSATFPGTLTRPVDPDSTFVAYKVFVLGRDGSVVGVSEETLLQIESVDESTTTSTAATSTSRVEDTSTSSPLGDRVETSRSGDAARSSLPKAEASTRIGSGAWEHRALAPASATATSFGDN